MIITNINILLAMEVAFRIFVVITLFVCWDIVNDLKHNQKIFRQVHNRTSELIEILDREIETLKKVLED